MQLQRKIQLQGRYASDDVAVAMMKKMTKRRFSRVWRILPKAKRPMDTCPILRSLLSKLLSIGDLNSKVCYAEVKWYEELNYIKNNIFSNASWKSNYLTYLELHENCQYFICMYCENKNALVSMHAAEMCFKMHKIRGTEILDCNKRTKVPIYCTISII